MIKNIKKWTLAAAIGLAAVGCTDKFEEINTDPNEPNEVPAGLMTADIIRVTANTMYSTGIGGDMGAVWSQQWSKIQYTDEELYIPRQSAIGSVWDNIYSAVLSNAKVMRNLALAQTTPDFPEGDKQLAGVATVLEVYGFALLTDVYGDVPFSQALLGGTDGVFTPSYDKQVDIYNDMLMKLDEAIAYLNGPGLITPSSDLLYGGDVTKWIKFANSLKVRILMRASDKSSEITNFNAQLQAAANGAFTSIDDEAKLAYLESAPNANPIFESVVQGNRTEYRMGEAFVELLKSLNDDRLTTMAELNDAGEYMGKPPVAENTVLYNKATVSGLGEKYLEATASGYFISFAETQFLLAEAAERGFITGGTTVAEEYYNAGVAASFTENEVSLALPAYMAQSTVAYGAGNKIEKIHTQKYIALFSQGIEAWTEQRRTGIPALSPAVNGAVTEIPSRYFYPATEQSLNGTSYQAAVSQQGDDELTTKIWWNK
ncbi:SusD/RagB family nutrient-binding outer membrane lipoprotein [Flammeovirga yaeyamensis]|uniref:SusD/RagB family nutrient-binding outer membrane lipoprotein n=1 Tax=Flammeovirga yaeyamensis TaxID=367791 RepID=A0AAX1N3I6_9BACT|nr:SusD/RagB family nutrient-binding outer membrane lipoprotein [Flammeovirga yaeyamensis]MBB3701059.1 hypothetical protein [Flammeovirga yaeyamensis]NMF38110.1 SusD/RagB family nutrient-binding outer membrane lipoprotein [Flammeovirga yaeyamensis]QWG01881.1 SusD/RagB family nutrient-binding outer membrane lipoprotein [Flammeovirga yaeyamensis]